MQRLRLGDFRREYGPQLVGLCGSDLPSVASIVNAAQRRLIYAKEAGEEGWWGSWAEVKFNVTQATPVITLDRWMARLERLSVCNNPTPIENQFYEYLDFGAGPQPRSRDWTDMGIRMYSRNNAVMFRDLTSPPQIMRVSISDPRDAGKHVLIQARDSNGNIILSQDQTQQVMGDLIALQLPFVNSAYQYTSVTGIQKDVTYGNVTFTQVDPTTGATVALHSMEPGETTAWYRRYLLWSLPYSCCCAGSATIQVGAMAKLELVPATVDSDYLLIQNLEALILECQAVRYSGMDSPNASAKSQEKHNDAVKLLSGELNHYIGKESPAVNIKPFGSACLEALNISMR